MTGDTELSFFVLLLSVFVFDVVEIFFFVSSVAQVQFSKYCVKASIYFSDISNNAYFCLFYISSFSFPQFWYGGCIVPQCPLGTARGFQHDDAG